MNQKLTFRIKDFGFKIVHFLDQSNLHLISDKKLQIYTSRPLDQKVTALSVRP